MARQGEHGYSNERSQSDRYYSSSERGNHYYEERDIISGSNNGANLRRSQEPPEPDRGKYSSTDTNFFKMYSKTVIIKINSFLNA